jgi:hypothetical protein
MDSLPATCKKERLRRFRGCRWLLPGLFIESLLPECSLAMLAEADTMLFPWYGNAVIGVCGDY